MDKRKTLNEWKDYYLKVLSDGKYKVSTGAVLDLREDDREYIEKQLARIESELKNASS